MKTALMPSAKTRKTRKKRKKITEKDLDDSLFIVLASKDKKFVDEYLKIRGFDPEKAPPQIDLKKILKKKGARKNKKIKNRTSFLRKKKSALIL